VAARPRLVVTSGDPGGIGPELVRRALAEPGLRGLAEFTVTGQADGASGAAAVPVGRPSAAGGRAAVAAVRSAVELLTAGSADALVTAPVSKEALQLAGYPWPGQTEMLASLCGASDLRVLLMAGPLRVVHVSAHRSLRRAVEAVTVVSVRRTIELADRFGRRLLGRPPRIAVAGLNPHAGEGGLLGDEDERFIRPAVEEERALGVDVAGPVSADTLFPRAAAGGADLVVAMYHDQGHIPVKLLGGGEGVAVTLGLPFLRMSPDHGAAFDIAGRGVARLGSMTAAIRAAAAAAGTAVAGGVTDGGVTDGGGAAGGGAAGGASAAGGPAP
jgi:4-hydroxythreonine-4-phosphate dehydrogenase